LGIIKINAVVIEAKYSITAAAVLLRDTCRKGKWNYYDYGRHETSGCV
jgi:hypothetical protein